MQKSHGNFYRGQRVKLDLEYLKRQRQASNFGIPASIALPDARGTIQDHGALMGGTRYYAVQWDGVKVPTDVPERVLMYA